MKFIVSNVQDDMFNMYPKLEKLKPLMKQEADGRWSIETGSFKTVMDIVKLSNPHYGIIIQQPYDNGDWHIIIYDGLVEDDDENQAVHNLLF